MSLTTPVAEIVEKSTSPLLAVHPTWRRVSLGDVADILNGFPFESQRFSKRDGKPLLRIRDVGETSTDCGYVGDFDKAYLIRRGDLVVGMDGDFNSAPWLGPEALLNQRVCKLTVVVDGYDRRFLELTLPGYLQAINDATSSVTVKHLSSRSVAEIPLPLPPFPEQRRIVAKIEELFSQLDAGVEELKKAKAQLKRYRQSVLKAAFEGKLTEEWRKAHRGKVEPASALLDRAKGARGRDSRRPVLPLPDSFTVPALPSSWAWENLETIRAADGPIMYGILQPGPDLEEGVPYVRPTEIESDFIVHDRIRRTTPMIAAKYARSTLRSGDILLTIVGTIGKVAIVPLQLAGANITQSSARVRVDSDIVGNNYLAWALRSTVLRRQFDAFRLGTGVPRLNIEHVRSLMVPVAPLVEQDAVLAEVEAKMSVVDAEEKTVDAALTQAARLRQSILKRAFDGRLVPQDPTDEPAERLLARIRAEKTKRAAAPSRGRGRRTATAGK